MHNSKIFEGKTTTEAIEKGLKEFNVSKEKVNIKILEQDKRSFFSILAPRIVKVEMSLKEEKKEISHVEKPKVPISENEKNEAKKVIEEFLKEFLEKLPQKDVEYKINQAGEYIEVSLKGKSISYLIGYRGETLNAMQVLLNGVLRNKMRTTVKVILDICGYKEERKITLEKLAERMARKVIETGKNVTLDPMKPYERKIIHSKLQQNSKIKTYSIGEEPHRKIVISLNK
ncbi:MAG: protein jag [Clostridia bacterium]|nr:protein jag [Clostridia bacterium]